MAPSAAPRPLVGYVDVVPLLVAACPSFIGSSESRRVDPHDGQYLYAAHLAVHLIGQLERRRTESFQAVSDMIEWILADGDREARTLIVEGFLDPLLEPAAYPTAGPSPLAMSRWLGCRARAAVGVGSERPTP